MRAKQLGGGDETTHVLVFGKGEEVMAGLLEFVRERGVSSGHLTAIGALRTRRGDAPAAHPSLTMRTDGYAALHDYAAKLQPCVVLTSAGRGSDPPCRPFRCGPLPPVCGLERPVLGTGGGSGRNCAAKRGLAGRC
jgi:hypothetical protein